MNRIFLFYILLSFAVKLQGQGFSKIIDYDPTGQCKHYLVCPKQDYIYVFGDYIDSARTIIRPFWAKYDYNGQRIKFDTLWDDKYKDPIIFDQSMPYVFQSDSVIIFKAQRKNNDKSSSYNLNNILKINMNNGHLIASTMINVDTLGIVNAMSFDSLTNSLIISTFSYENRNMINLLEYDSSLNITYHSKLILDSNYSFIPTYIRKKQDNYLLIGTSYVYNKSLSTIAYFCVNVDFNGNIQYFKELESSVPLGEWLLNNYRNVERKDGDFILGGNYLVNYLPTERDANLFAHPVRTNANFDTIRWELKMYDKPNYLYPYQFYNGLISINNEKEYIGYGDDLDTLSGSCVLYKFNEAGDSLWYKRIIPGDAKRDSLGWVPTYMAAESPRGGIVVVGCVYDNRKANYKSIRSYIMYLDDDGCLVPDCNKPVTVNDIENGRAKYFKVWPNPINEQLHVLCNYERDQKYIFTLINFEGSVVWNRIISCHKSDQIFWSIEDIPTGNYYLQIQDGYNKIVQVEKLIKL